MKSLVSIINKLSQSEVDTFRVFLSRHNRNGKNKKLELFNMILHRDKDVDFMQKCETSRQSAHQLKRRLQEELYSFLISQEQVKSTDHQLYVEMECHRKIYCFKILFDKGIKDHARKVLQEVIDASLKQSLHSLYLEAINLRNTHFPLTEMDVDRTIPINYEIQKWRESLTTNLYINHYLTESTNTLHESDQVFRCELISQFGGFDLANDDSIVKELMHVNILLKQREFDVTHQILADLSKYNRNTRDGNILSLLYIELIKVCLCREDLDATAEWIELAGRTINVKEPFSKILLELKFIFSLRSSDIDICMQILQQAKHTKEIIENHVLTTRWSFYSLFLHFSSGEFRKVIKSINADPVFAFKNKSWLLTVKTLELLSIYQLNDFDWLSYKIDTFRKIINATDSKQERILAFINFLRHKLNGKYLIDNDNVESFAITERNLPWHPLSIEIQNFFTYIQPSVTRGQIILQD